MIDKITHFFAGTTIALFVMQCNSSILIALAITLFLGLFKEFFDFLNPNNGNFNFWDLFATVLGGIIGAAASAICILI